MMNSYKAWIYNITESMGLATKSKGCVYVEMEINVDKYQLI